MAKKKSRKKTLSRSMFKLTGANAKMKVDSKKKKLYYFRTKLKSEKAKKNAASDGADILEVAPTDVKVAKPSLKYDFYCEYDAVLNLSFLRKRNQEIGVTEQVKGVLIGKEVLKPKKKGEFHSIKADMVELFEIKRTDGMILDGRTGGPARALEKLLKGPGKKKATSAWVKKNKISSGKFNSLEKVIRTVSKMAKQKPSGAKRITSHSLEFKKLVGYYVPVYYVRVSAGAKKQTIKINAVDGSISVAV